MRSPNLLVNLLKSNSTRMKLTGEVTLVVKTTDGNTYKLAADLIREGRVIAVPTDTIYGLACDATSESGVRRIYDIKRRDERKPIAICVGDLAQLRKYGRSEHLPDALLERLLPGPVTLVLRQTRLLGNAALNPGTDLIGVRIPDFDFIRRVATAARVPVALTSANPSSQPSCLRVDEFSSLHSQLSAVFDGGTLGEGDEGTRVGSTVVDLSRPGSYRLIRRGISCDSVVEVLRAYGITEG